MICHDLIESVPFSEYSGQLPKHSHHIKAPTWSMRPQRTRASRTLGKTVPCSMTIPGSLRHAPAWILTGIALPLSSAQVPLTHGAPWEDHAEKEVQSIDTYDGKQIVPQLGKSETRPQTQTECFMHFTHCHGSPSPPSKPIFQERNTSKQKCYFWVKAFILEIWYISEYVFLISFLIVSVDQVGSRQSNQTQPIHDTFPINPKALDGWFCSLGLGARLAGLKEGAPSCLPLVSLNMFKQIKQVTISNCYSLSRLLMAAAINKNNLMDTTWFKCLESSAVPPLPSNLQTFVMQRLVEAAACFFSAWPAIRKTQRKTVTEFRIKVGMHQA